MDQPPPAIMVSVNDFECADGTYAECLVGDRSEEQRTYTGIEFVIDGRLLREHVIDDEGRPLAGGDVSLFNAPYDSPAQVLLQHQQFEDDPEVTKSGRTPILMCQCGDPYCGALMARITITGQRVTWSDWAWDHFYEPSRAAINIPTFTFDLEQYRTQLELAAARSLHPRLVSAVEATWTFTFLDFLFPSREKNPRILRRKHMAALDARPLTPTHAEATGEYAAFLRTLANSHAQVRHSYSERTPTTDAHRVATIQELTTLRASPFVQRLPDVTIDAIDWFLDDLRS